LEGSCQGGGISSLRALPERAAHRGTVVEFISKSYEGKKILEGISLEVKNRELVTPFAPTGEGLNFASAFDLPVMFMIENNHYAVSTRVEAKIYRHGGHYINDPGLYIDQKVLVEWKERDPLKLLRSKTDNKDEKKKIEAQEDKDLDEAIKV